MSDVTFEAVSKGYGGNLVVKDLDFTIPGGQFTSILGPSGCGKTTLLRMLAGFMTPDTGEIRNGTAVLSTPGTMVPPEKRGMGMVFQQYAIWPHMNVFENVSFGLEMAQVPRHEIGSRVAEALETVGLGGYESRGSADLSGGQQQRLALARALVTRPSVLLLDEPLSNLDARLRERMRFELRELQQRTGITFVYVTHDQVEAMSMSDTIAIMRSGVIEQHGAPEELYNRPVSAFVIDFLGLNNWFDGTVVGMDGDRARVKVTSGATVTGTAAPGIAVDANVRVAVRPEDFVPTDRPAGQDNVLAGEVTQSLFMGSYLHHSVKVPGREDNVVVQTGRGARVQQGPINIWADPHLTHVVPASDL
ncbi:ABC transporter ATP-binding protein [Ornithinimicrobium cavernae]|uniref:ABC transporter ATP-binding protein n=1 Tax=Ornithinimicrobium cavernae TaxID=2666047 RepID=UPI000D691183|nr:ABC transporter ATP-binding protein [Ornithinimicrobium cavernae]